MTKCVECEKEQDKSICENCYIDLTSEWVGITNTLLDLKKKGVNLIPEFKGYIKEKLGVEA